MTWPECIVASTLSPRAKLAALTLAHVMKEDGEAECALSVDQIARFAGFSLRTAQRALAELERDGYLVRVVRPRLVTLYRTALPTHSR
jgi:Fic family protein